MRSSLMQHGVEGHLVKAIEDFAGGCRRARTFDRVDRNDDGVIGNKFVDQRRQVGLPE